MPTTQYYQPANRGSGQPTIGELQEPHAEYQANLINEYQTWYDGGNRFREALLSDSDGTYLVLRRADKDRLDSNHTYRQLRASRAQYSSEIGRIVASMQATILRNPPLLIDTDDYIRSLNEDCDGAGSDLKDLARRVLECGLLHKRAYLAPTFPGDVAPGADLAQALEGGALDGKIRFYHARDVIWWTHDAAGRLNSVRIHAVNEVYSRGSWGILKEIVHTWAVIDDETITRYTYRQEARAGVPVPMDPQKEAVFGGTQAHGFDRCPVREYEFGEAFWVADRLVDPQKRLSNSEADEAFIRSECAHPQRVIIGTPASSTDDNGNNTVKGGPVYAVTFPDAGGDYKMVGPDAAQSSWHSEAIARDRQNLYAALESLFLGLAAQGQNARQAASAKAMDASHSTLFMAFAAALLESLLLSTVLAIKSKRGSTSPVSLEGLNKIDGRTVEQATMETEAFLKLGPPNAAKEWLVRSVSTRMCAGAPQEVLDQILTEPLVEPKVLDVPKPGMPKPDAGDDDTGNQDQE